MLKWSYNVGSDYVLLFERSQVFENGPFVDLASVVFKIVNSKTLIVIIFAAFALCIANVDAIKF